MASSQRERVSWLNLHMSIPQRDVRKFIKQKAKAKQSKQASKQAIKAKQAKAKAS
jgi:hypothetical protein